MKRENLNTISLFSGALGLDLGLEQAGFTTRVTVEINESAINTIKANKPNLPIIGSAIQGVSTKELLNKAGLSGSEVTLVAGGPCCQSFSTAGKRGSVCDPRGALFQDYCRVIREVRPRFFVMENVRGLLSAAIKHRPLNERGPGFPSLAPEEELGSAFNIILNELRSLGYYIVYGLLNTANYGTPQSRQRIVIIGSRDGENISLPKPTHSLDGKNGMQKWVTLKKALVGTRSKEWVGISPDQLTYLKLLGPGQNWTSLPKKLQAKAIGGAYYSWGGRSGFCRRLAWNKPSPSLTTQPNGKATMLCHPVKNRPLSVEEYARIQEFPDDYTFVGSISDKYLLIGNAVPLGLGRAIGRMLMDTMTASEENGLPRDVGQRRGQVMCGDPSLEKRLQRRSKTLLPPPRFRANSDPKAAKQWLAKTGKKINYSPLLRSCGLQTS